jgi:hypothetical protein
MERPQYIENIEDTIPPITIFAPNGTLERHEHPEHLTKEAYISKIKNKAFGETGPVSADTKVVVTDYSLHHYLAQKYNLHFDDMPKSKPEALHVSNCSNGAISS